MSLRALLRWFRSEWQAEMGERITVHATAPDGAPDWHERFRSLMAFTDSDVPGGELGELRSFPLRWALRSMARGGSTGQRRARFLFLLTCQDWSIPAAAEAVSPAAHDVHGKDWAVDYARQSLSMLYHRVHDPERTDAQGRPRTFVERRISKSEAQYRAEEAA